MVKPLPMLFEVDHDRAMTLREVLGDCSPGERSYLIANPVDLGVRCESFLSGTAPEWMREMLTDVDRQRLGQLVEEAPG